MVLGGVVRPMPNHYTALNNERTSPTVFGYWNPTLIYWEGFCINMDKSSENVNTDTCHLPRYRLHGILKYYDGFWKVRYNLLWYLHKWKKGGTITTNGTKYYMSGTRKAICRGNTLTMYASFNTSKNGILNSQNKKAYIKYGKHTFKLTSKTKYYFSGRWSSQRLLLKIRFHVYHEKHEWIRSAH